MAAHRPGLQTRQQSLLLLQPLLHLHYTSYLISLTQPLPTPHLQGFVHLLSSKYLPATYHGSTCLVPFARSIPPLSSLAGLHLPVLSNIDHSLAQLTRSLTHSPGPPSCAIRHQPAPPPPPHIAAVRAGRPCTLTPVLHNGRGDCTETSTSADIPLAVLVGSVIIAPPAACASACASPSLLGSPIARRLPPPRRHQARCFLHATTAGSDASPPPRRSSAVASNSLPPLAGRLSSALAQSLASTLQPRLRNTVAAGSTRQQVLTAPNDHGAGF